MKKEIKETTIGPNVVQTGGGLKHLSYLDREAPIQSVKWIVGEPKETFMKRCVALETSRHIKKPPEKAAELCEVLYQRFLEQEKLISNENIQTSDIAKTSSKLKDIFTRNPSVSAANPNLLFETLDYLIQLDEIFLTLEQAAEFETILKDLEAIGLQLDESHMFNKQASGSRKALMRKYYRKHKLQILMKRKQLKRSIKGKNRDRKKEIMAKSDRTETGRKKHKSWGAQNHLNEHRMYGDHDCDYTIFEKASGEGKRAQFSDFIKPLKERKKAFSKLNAKLHKITGRITSV